MFSNVQGAGAGRAGVAGRRLLVAQAKPASATAVQGRQLGGCNASVKQQLMQGRQPAGCRVQDVVAGGVHQGMARCSACSLLVTQAKLAETAICLNEQVLVGQWMSGAG